MRYASIWHWLWAVGLLAVVGCGAADRPADHGAASAEARRTDSPAAATAAGARVEEEPSPDVGNEADSSFETVLAPLRDVEVFARVAGVVQALDVEEGRRVTVGNRLARIDDREQQATLDECKAQEDRAKLAWDRAQRLHEEKVISEEQWIAARSEWQIATARRQRAEVELSHCSVTSPIAGVVALRRVQAGQMVKENDLLFRISDPDRLRAELLLPESWLGTVRPGQTVRILPAAGGATSARVSRVSSLVDPTSGTFRVTIDVDNRGGRLPSGVSARVVLEPASAKR